MQTFEEMERQWTDGPRPPRAPGRVALIVLRKGNGVHETPASACLTPAEGLRGDRWATGPRPERGRQVTLMMTRAAEILGAGAQALHEAGDNVLVDLDLSEAALPVGSRLRLGSAMLQVTPEPHMGCAGFRERFGADALRWVNWKPHRHRRLRGVNCLVLEAGEVAVGNRIDVLPPLDPGA